ncbi:MAG: porin [Gallionellaceae bacterium]
MNSRIKLLLTLTIAAFSAQAVADIPLWGDAKNGVSVYGVADAMLGTVQHSYTLDSQYANSDALTKAFPASGNGSNAQTGLINGGISPSRLGLNGNHDLGDGIKAFFTIEAGINVTTGRLSNAAGCLQSNSGTTAATQNTDCSNSAVNGRIDSRQGFVGISEERAGSFALGRNYAVFSDVLSAYDPVQYSQQFSILGASGGYGGSGGISEDSRVDDSLKYKNSFGPLKLALLYKPNSTPGSTSAKSAAGFSIGYEQGNLGIQAGYQSFTDALKGAISTVVGDVKVTAYDNTAYAIAAKYMVNDAATVKAGYESFTLKAASDNITSFTYYWKPVDNAHSSSYTGPDQTTDISWIGGDYNFTDKLNVAAGYYDLNFKAYTGTAAGAAHCFSVLADYTLNKKLDTYAGIMTISFSGSQTSPTLISSNQIAGIGARFKF